jgi:hypothetical protein
MTDFEIELYDNYTRCSALNIPDVSTRLYYPIIHLGEFRIGELLEIDDENILAHIYGVGKFKDKIENFWTKK